MTLPLVHGTRRGGSLDFRVSTKMGSRQCAICGKLLKSGSEEAMVAHQRESQSCFPKAGRSDSEKVKRLEARLAAVIAEGKALGEGRGTFEESEKNVAERAEVERQLKQARKDTKADKQAIKQLAQDSLSASWTQGVLDGDAKYVKGEDGIESKLAAETIGLVTADQFREKKKALEAEAAEKRCREAEEAAGAAAAQRKRKEAKRAKREQQERRGLSFVEDDE